MLSPTFLGNSFEIIYSIINPSDKNIRNEVQKASYCWKSRDSVYKTFIKCKIIILFLIYVKLWLVK